MHEKGFLMFINKLALDLGETEASVGFIASTKMTLSSTMACEEGGESGF